MRISNIDRKEYLDILKIVACFCVLIDHTNYYISTASNLIPWDNRIEYEAAFLYYTIAHVAVTLFVMISGANLLRKDEPYKKTFKRILRCIIVIFVFSLLYYVCRERENALSGPGVKGFILQVVRGELLNHYWYMYMYLGLLVMLPILRKLVKNLKESEYIYIFIFTILCSFDFITGINQWIELPIFKPFLGLFILGYYMDNYDIRDSFFSFFKKSKVVFWVSTVGLIIDVCFVSLYSARESMLDNTRSNRFFCWDNIFYIYMAMYLFYWIKYFCNSSAFKNNHFFRGFVEKAVSGTFGIYLLHGTVVILFSKVWGTFLRISVIPYIIKWIIMDFILYLACWLFTYLLKKIPGMEKLI